jgi:hypothetical protein
MPYVAKVVGVITYNPYFAEVLTTGLAYDARRLSSIHHAELVFVPKFVKHERSDFCRASCRGN